MQAPTAPVFLCQKDRRRGNDNPTTANRKEGNARSAYHGQAPEGDDERGHDRHDDEYQDRQGALDSCLAHPGGEQLGSGGRHRRRGAGVGNLRR